MQVANEAPKRETTARLSSLADSHAHVTVLALTLLAGGLGFLRLRYRSVNFDESIAMGYARESWTSLWHTVTGEDPNMSLYYATLKLWSSALGDSVLAYRSLSVLAASLCVPVVYAIGARLFTVPAGLFAGLLMATNVFFLQYAQEARGYALLVLLTALSTYFFLVEAERSRGWSRTAYVASSVLAFHVHFFAVWVVLVHVLALVATKGRRAGQRSWLVNYGVMAVLAAPMAWRALTLDENPIGWLAEPDFGAIPATFAQLAGNSFLHLGAVVALSTAGLRAAAGSKRLAFGLAFTASWAVLPVLLSFAVSQAKPIFLAKYLIMCLPAIALLAAGAVTSLRPIGAALVAAFLLVGLSGPELRAWYGFRGQEDWRSLAAYVLDGSRPADGVIYNASYARDSVVGYVQSRSTSSDLDSAGADGSPAEKQTRVWLVLAHSQPTTASLRSGLARHYRLKSRRVFDGDIAVELYVQRASR